MINTAPQGSNTVNGRENTSRLLIETFRFEGKNDYEYEIWFKVFFVYCQKIDTPEFLIVPFFTRKFSTVIVIEGGWALSRLQNAKTSNIW